MFGSYFLIVIGFLSACYVVLAGVLIKGWSLALKTQNVSRETLNERVKITVLVPVRNEEKNIQQLLQTLAEQRKIDNRFEIIVINDHSDDKTMEMVRDFKMPSQITLKTIDLTNDFGKKKAILAGVNEAGGDLIITVDADCLIPHEWLAGIAAHHTVQQKDFYILPVCYRKGRSFFEKFQSLEFLTMVGIGAATHGLGNPVLCNGANLCFTKKCFNQVGGYENNFRFASGDDVFLLQKIKRAKDLSIGLIMDKKVCVITEPKQNFKDLLHQKIRWASKSGIYKDTFTNIIGAVFLMMNLCLVTGIILSFLWPKTGLAVLVAILVKLLVDALYLGRVLKWFNRTKLLSLLVYFELLYPFYFTLILITAMFLQPKWKGRKLNTYQINRAGAPV